MADRSNYSIWPSDYRASRGLQAGIDGLALERENAKHAFVAPPKRFAVNETLERFDPERELAQSERARPLVFSVDAPDRSVAAAVGIDKSDDGQTPAGSEIES